MRGPRILTLLVGGGALAGFGRRGIARGERGAGRGLELLDQLLDELTLVHTGRVAPGPRASKF